MQITNAQTDVRKDFHAADFPLLLHGSSHSSAPIFAAAIIQSEVTYGRAVVAISLHRSDIHRLQKQLGLQQPARSGTRADEKTMTAIDDHLLVTIVYPRADEVLVALRSLHNWQERLVVVLGAEKTLTPGIWNTVKDAPRLVVCGDFSLPSTHIEYELFKTQIAFSAWPSTWERTRPELPSYLGVNHKNSEQYFVVE